MLNSAEHEIFYGNKYENANTSLQLLVILDLLARQLSGLEKARDSQNNTNCNWNITLEQSTANLLGA